MALSFTLVQDAQERRPPAPKDRVALRGADLHLPVPLDRSSFDVAISLDVVVHLPNREVLFHEMARLLVPTWRLPALTDAGVITGPISNEEIERRSVNGYMQFVPPEMSEELLEAAGFRLIVQEDRTGSVVFNAIERLRAMLAHRAEVEAAARKEAFARQQRYVETVVATLGAKSLVSNHVFR